MEDEVNFSMGNLLDRIDFLENVYFYDFSRVKGEKWYDHIRKFIDNTAYHIYKILALGPHAQSYLIDHWTEELDDRVQNMLDDMEKNWRPKASKIKGVFDKEYQKYYEDAYKRFLNRSMNDYLDLLNKNKIPVRFSQNEFKSMYYKICDKLISESNAR